MTSVGFSATVVEEGREGGGPSDGGASFRGDQLSRRRSAALDSQMRVPEVCRRASWGAYSLRRRDSPGWVLRQHDRHAFVPAQGRHQPPGGCVGR